MDKKNILFCTNCQGHAISKYLLTCPIFEKNYNVDNIENWILLKDQDKSKYLDKLKICDIFIYQPLKKKHGELSTETENGLKTYLKPDCKLISFPYIYNSALWPFYHHVSDGEEFYPGLSGFRIHNESILLGLVENFNLQQIINLYDNDNINFNYLNNYNYTIDYLKKNEENVNIKVSNFIEENIKKKRLFFTKDHPTSFILIYCANKILEILNINYIINDSDFDINYHEMLDTSYNRIDNKWPITQQCANTLGLSYFDTDGKHFFRDLLLKMLLIQK